VDKTGTASNVLHAHPDKTGMPLQELADAHLDKTGVEPLVFHASVEDNGTVFQNNVLVLLETGTVFHVFNALLVKLGTPQVFHAHAHQPPTGMVSHV